MFFFYLTIFQIKKILSKHSSQTSWVIYDHLVSSIQIQFYNKPTTGIQRGITFTQSQLKKRLSCFLIMHGDQCNPLLIESAIRPISIDQKSMKLIENERRKMKENINATLQFMMSQCKHPSIIRFMNKMLAKVKNKYLKS